MLKMTKRSDILNELKELGSKLPVAPLENIYTVPGGYFEGFASQVIARIKAIEAADMNEELGHLSSYLKSLPQENPYKVPAGYFENLEGKIMNAVRESSDYQTIDEELESLSPLLNSLKEKNPYSVPQGYFEDLSTPVIKETKVVSITNRKWFRMAAAAVVIGIVALSGLFIIKNNRIDPTKNSHAWVEKSMKKVSTDKIDEFIKLAETEKPYEATASLNGKADDVKELIKDIPENEIQDFLKDTEPLTDDESILMN
jgi:hypothetical protein